MHRGSTPTIRPYVDAGDVMSCGADVNDVWRRAATCVDEILEGAKPGDLQVEQPTNFELVTNLKAAKAVGLTIPLSFMQRLTAPLPRPIAGGPWPAVTGDRRLPGELKVIAPILARPVIERTLKHPGLEPQPPPKGPAREVGAHLAD